MTLRVYDKYMRDDIYKHKFILNNDSTKSTVTLYSNDMPDTTNFKPYSQQDRSGHSKYKDSNYRKTIKRRSNTVRKLIVNNFQIGYTSFLTLTFSDNFVSDDYHTLSKYFLLFIRRIKKSFDNFKYIAVMVPASVSDTNSPRPHFHMVCNFDDSISHKEISDLWKYGYVSNTTPYTKSEFKRQSDYVIKNLKEAAPYLNDVKGYLCSKGLNRPIIIDESDNRYLAVRDEIKKSKKTTEYVSQYKNIDNEVVAEYHNSFWSKKYSDKFVKLSPAIRKHPTM